MVCVNFYLSAIRSVIISFLNKNASLFILILFILFNIFEQYTPFQYEYKAYKAYTCDSLPPCFGARPPSSE
jgi:hypothetical protein